MVGPFIFFDQIGPGEFLTGTGLDVRPYPHIGLSTVTDLFEGEIMHCDTLGVEQSIAPGALNWVTAGSGIAHSERRDAAARDRKRTLFGIQSWAAPPKDQEEIAPAFAYHAAETLPFAEEEGLRLRLIARDGWGLRSPVSGA
ncbi:MAG: yhhW 2 [Rhodospirillales bacterium]|nr:yhhW 2 [Rhodospirillales bacterium]